MLASCIVIATGDVVEVVLEFDNPQVFRVLDTHKRYGIPSDGILSRSFIIGQNVNTGEIQPFDCRWVKAIRSRAKIPAPPTNIFKKKDHLDYIRRAVTVRGSTWVGDLKSLAAFALSKFPYWLDRPIHPSRLLKLYARDNAGFKKRELIRWWYVEELGIDERRSVYTVDGRRFMRWVARNHTRILITAAEQIELDIKLREEMLT